MKNVLVVSFDLIRPGEVETSLAVASLLAYLKSREGYGDEFIVHHVSFNMFGPENQVTEAALEKDLLGFRLEDFDTVGISCYVWNEYLVNVLIDQLRTAGFTGKIVLGGYQISYGKERELRYEYPNADVFVSGYAEHSFFRSILMDKPENPVYMDNVVDFSDIPSVYTSNEIQVPKGQKMLRLETKRGCPYRCSFCAHRDLGKNKLYRHEKNKVFEELSFLKSRDVKRINVLDPVFNIGNDYLDVLREVKRINLGATLTLQTRLEMIKGEMGTKFLDSIEQINAHLEFGVQTIVEEEYKVISRSNDTGMIKDALRRIGERNLSYEASLIYGLPHQTVDSFRRSIDFLRSNGCDRITAYPLMLLKGTELYAQKETYGFVEKPLGDFNIPTVVESRSFSEDDWLTMHEMAEQLDPSVRF